MDDPRPDATTFAFLIFASVMAVTVYGGFFWVASQILGG